MANQDNLVSFSERTTSEQRKIASLGGKASGEARRKKRNLKESMSLALEIVEDEMILNAKKSGDSDLAKKINDIGIIPLELINLALKEYAKDESKLKAIKYIIEILEPQTQTSETIKQVIEFDKEKAKQVLKEIDEELKG